MAYEIIIKNETGGSSGGASPIAGDTSQSKKQFTTGQIRTQNALKLITAYDKFVDPFVKQVIQQTVSTIELRTGAAELQQRVEFGLNIAESAVGLGTSILAGYAVGNLPGAIIGGLISLGTTALNYANRAKTIQMQSDLESITLRGMTIRAGGYAPSAAESRNSRQ